MKKENLKTLLICIDVLDSFIKLSNNYPEIFSFKKINIEDLKKEIDEISNIQLKEDNINKLISDLTDESIDTNIILSFFSNELKLNDLKDTSRLNAIRILYNILINIEGRQLGELTRKWDVFKNPDLLKGELIDKFLQVSSKRNINKNILTEFALDTLQIDVPVTLTKPKIIALIIKHLNSFTGEVILSFYNKSNNELLKNALNDNSLNENKNNKPDKIINKKPSKKENPNKNNEKNVDMIDVWRNAIDNYADSLKR